MARRDRRSWGRRELKRATDEKTAAFFALYHEGFSRAAIASKLNMDLRAVEKMSNVVEGEEAIATPGVGGGQE